MSEKSESKKSEKQIKGPETFKGLLILKKRKQTPRGLKFTVTSGGTIKFTTPDGADYFSMSAEGFAEAAARNLGFTVAK